MTIPVLSFLGVCSLGIIIRSFALTLRAFNKYDSLDTGVQTKLVKIDNYMILVRNFSTEELNKLGEMSKEEVSDLNEIRDRALLVQKAREKI
jgi:hypothetical protein